MNLASEQESHAGFDRKKLKSHSGTSSLYFHHSYHRRLFAKQTSALILFLEPPFLVKILSIEMNKSSKRKVINQLLKRPECLFLASSRMLFRLLLTSSCCLNFLQSLAMPAATSPSLPPSARKDATRLKIEQMELERKERRKSMIQLKQARKEQSRKNIAEGNPGDIDFIGMVGEWRRKQQEEHKKSKPPTPSPSNICIAVRKRPMFEKERAKLDHDSVSCYHPKVWIHSAKFKVDGITKYLTHNSFQLDHAFGEDSTTQQIYLATTLPLVDHVVSTQGRATVFCYGQTGSGKTYTMNGIQQILAHDLYGQLAEVQSELDITVAFFELYGGYCQDLLHGRKRCKLLEDGKGEINITGLQEVPAPTAEDFLKVIEKGHG